MNFSLKNLYRWAAALLLIEAFLIFVPTFVLGTAINWPASLDEPASVNLPLILEQWDAVLLGYGVYLIYSIVFLPVALLTAQAVSNGNESQSTLLKIATGFAVASTVSRVLGIVRWLFPMPVLARLYTDPAATDATRETISITYDMLNAYAGTVGEWLGVSLFAALWATLVGVYILRTAFVPRWLGVFGLVAAAALYSLLPEVAGIDMGAMTVISVVVLHIWFMALAGVLLWRSRMSAPEPQLKLQPLA